MSILQTLRDRCLVDNVTSVDLSKKLSNNSLCFYVGFDPTADSYHVGQLAVFNLMGLLQDAGHKPIALVGGATGMVGDPGGKSKERNLLSQDQIKSNIAGQQQQLQRFLCFEGKCAARIMNNHDWLGKWSYLDFLRDVGKHFSVNQMMARDSVKSRLSREGEGISYTEFSYMLLQSYDFYYLCQHENCTLQLGGSDQWGNIVSGIDLTRRMIQKEVFGLTMPLVTKSDGTKFGKSESGTVWLSADKTSPFAFYQFFLRTEDADVGRFLRMLTTIPLNEIEALEETLESQAHLRHPQKRLAEFLTRRVHGDDQLQRVLRASEAMYGGEIADLDDQTVSQIFADVPTHTISTVTLKEGWSILEALAEAGACKSKSEARRLIVSGGAYLNNKKVTDIDFKLTAADLVSASYLVLRTGKRNYRLVRVGC